VLPNRSTLPDRRGLLATPLGLGLPCVLLAGWCVLGAGCSGEDGPRRVPVHGKATLDGAPVENASISFLPADGLHGPAATAVIRAGEYRLGAEDGPVAGAHRVVVLLDGDEKTASPAGRAGRLPKAGSVRQWDFRVVVPEEGPFVYDVTLR